MASGPLLDQNKLPIPECNITDQDANRQFYVSNPDAYTSTKKEVETDRTVTLLATGVFIVLLCIFTLNLNASGWTAGNILTFAIVVAMLYVITLYGKKWLKTSAALSQMISSGNPCTQISGESRIVYCKG